MSAHPFDYTATQAEYRAAMRRLRLARYYAVATLALSALAGLAIVLL